MYIYLDTNLWNILCDQAVNPAELLAALTAKRVKPVLSTHTVYELTRTFYGSPERGRRLLSYVGEFIDASISCAKDTGELLASEMYALKQRSFDVDAFLSDEAYPLLRQEVVRLSGAEDPGKNANKFIADRRDLAAAARASPSRYFEGRPDAKEALRAIQPKGLAGWLERETFGPIGVELLANHIILRFPEATQNGAQEYALALLNSPVGRLSRGLVRSDLYYTWRCAHRNSNPSDLIEDVYHVLNAAHCNVYATGEQKQEEYATRLLRSGTRVAVYKAETSVARWLKDLT